MSENVQKFQLTQAGKKYILTTQIEGNFVKLTCVESEVANSPIYLGRFSLVQLQRLSKMFNTMKTISQAQEFLNQSIENQKVSVESKGNLINITLYFQSEVKVEQTVTKDLSSQAINYNTQPVEYNAVEEQQYVNLPVTTNETVESTTNYNFNFNIPETTNYDLTQDNNLFTTTTQNETYTNTNYDFGTTTTNYDNYQTYDNLNIDTNLNTLNTLDTFNTLNTNTNYDYNLNNAVEVQQTQMNTYETTVQTPQMETLTLPLSLNQVQAIIPKTDDKKYLEEIEKLKTQIKILREENTILKTKTVEKTIVTKTDNSNEILLLKQEIERLKQQLAQYINIQKAFENYKRVKEQEVAHLKLRIEELLRQITASQQTVSSGEKQTLTIQDTRLEVVKGDIIKTASELELLTRKMSKDYNKITLNLLYKATVDSDKASVFHEKCDGADNTLVLIESTNGKRFGGFTSCSWEGNSIEKKDEDAFVFSLDKKEIYDVLPDEDAIGCYPKYGPVFLGCQIRVYDEFFQNGGTTFEKGVNYDTKEDFELSGGLKNFDVKEIEVYSIELE